MSRLFYSPTAQLLIEVIPKCGLQTIISTLLQIEGHDLHSLDPKLKVIGKFSKLCKKYEIFGKDKNDIPKITVVRNPYSRGLSAFSNKAHRILRGVSKDSGVYSYDQFEKFIKTLRKNTERTSQQMNSSVEQWSVWAGQDKSNLSSPRAMAGSAINTDHHFMPITRQISNIEKYDRVFCLEDIDSFYEYLNSRAAEISPARGKIQFIRKPLNVSGSISKYISYLTSEYQLFYMNYYGDDFRILGYSTDIKDILRPATISKGKYYE